MSDTTTPTTFKKDFFISYNHKDATIAEWIAWELDAQGYNVVFQDWDFRPGGNFVLDMQRAATECSHTIAVLSENYLNAQFTQPEWAAAFARDPMGENGYLIPIKIASCNIVGLLGPIIYIDLVGLAEEQARNTLVSKINQSVNKTRLRPEQAPTYTASPPDNIPTDSSDELLILLVGGNNLPNYIVAKHLYLESTLPPNIALLYTDKYYQHATILREQIEQIPKRCGNIKTHLSVSAISVKTGLERSELAEGIKKVTKGYDGKIHLNYTGGRKIMGFYARTELENLRDRRMFHSLNFSYLDPENYVLRSEGESTSNDLRETVKLDLRELLKIQGWNLLYSPTVTQPERKITREKIKERIDTSGNFKYRSFKEEINSWSSGDPSQDKELEEEIYRLDWLREYVNDAIFKWEDNPTVYTYSQVEAQRPDSKYNYAPKFDLLAMRGYELTLFTCPVTSNRGELENPDSTQYQVARAELKAHTFEALHRARQLGGSESRVVLVTLDPNPQHLKEELKEDFRDEDYNLFVIGWHDLQDIENKLRNEIFK